MTNDIKPCRACGKIPEKGYPPSRIVKKDWICTTCANEARNKWWARYRFKKLQAKNYEGAGSTVAALEAQLEFIEVMEDAPTCPFCNGRMKPNRTYKDRGKRLTWQCQSCNDAILAKEI